MSLLTKIVTAAATALLIKTDEDAIRNLLRIIENSKVELNDTDQAIVNFIKTR